MNKEHYFNTFKNLLNQYDMPLTLIDEILEDYQSMWDQYKALDMSEEDILIKLGLPESNIEALTEGYTKLSTKKLIKKRSIYQKTIALTPFIALPLFFLIGFLIPNGFTFAWISFLLIPMTAIVLQGPRSIIQKMTALSPFIAIIIFMTLGFGFNLWHPGWIVFLLTPAIGILNHPKRTTIIFYETLLALTVTSFFIIEYSVESLWIIPNTTTSIPYALLAFIPYVVIMVGQLIYKLLKQDPIILVLLVASTLLFLAMGHYLNWWPIAWLAFFIVPIYGIMKHTNPSQRLVAVMPLISTILFMTLGYFFNLWAFAWLVYLLIPVVAIIKNA